MFLVVQVLASVTMVDEDHYPVSEDHHLKRAQKLDDHQGKVFEDAEFDDESAPPHRKLMTMAAMDLDEGGMELMMLMESEHVADDF